MILICFVRNIIPKYSNKVFGMNEILKPTLLNDKIILQNTLPYRPPHNSIDQ
jgi:hypothetical protein